MITDGVKKQIDEDIKICKDALDGKIESLDRVYPSLKAKYIGLIDNYDKNLNEHIGIGSGMRDKVARDGLSKILSRLEIFKSNGYCNFKKEILPQNPLTNINITNNNENNLNFSFNFDEVIENIKNNGALDDFSIKEITDKIEELKEIHQSKDTKKIKWSKAKSIMLWLADKGVDIAIQLLPLIFVSLK